MTIEYQITTAATSRPDPEVLISSGWLIPAFAAGLITAAFLFFLVAFFVSDSPNTYTELTKEQRAEPVLYATLTPKTMRVVVLSHDDFAKQKSKPNAVAWASINTAPCTVYIEEGMYVQFHPANGYVGGTSFINPDNAGTIAHEMLHCYLGRWHD